MTTDVSRKAGELWKNMSDSDKKPYTTKAKTLAEAKEKRKKNILKN